MQTRRYGQSSEHHGCPYASLKVWAFTAANNAKAKLESL